MDRRVNPGTVMAFCGALILSLDALLLRMISDAPLTMAFWRSALMALSAGGARAVLRAMGLGVPPLPLDRFGLAASAFYGISSVCFVTGAMMTNIGNLLVILATAPIWAAIGASLFLRETTPLRTWIASVAAVLGISLVVSPGLMSGGNIGDVIALLTSWSMAGAFVVSRATSRNLALAPALGGLFSAICLLPFVEHFELPRTGQYVLMIIEGGLLMPLALGLIATAPRYIPAAQVSLFLLLETVLGPLWIWVGFGIMPSHYAIAGGAIVISCLAVNIVPTIIRRRGAETDQPLSRKPRHEG